MKRITNFIHPLFYEDIVGKKIKKSIPPETTITRELFKNKVLAIIVARMDSSRLPNKAIKLINNKPAIEHLFERVSIAKKKDLSIPLLFAQQLYQ